MKLPRPSSPVAAWRDFRSLLAQQERHKLIIALIAIAMPALIVTGFYVDAQPEKPKPQVIYVQSWPADRSDAEIEAQQKIDQAKKEKAMAERRRQYQALERKLGI